jgi:hypothetical protein
LLSAEKEIPTAVLQCQRPVSLHAKPDGQYNNIDHISSFLFNSILKIDHPLSGMTQPSFDKKATSPDRGDCPADCTC